MLLMVGRQMTPLDLLTLLSYIALNVDILFQIKRIYQTKSSHDLSLTGMSIRYAAILIIMIKFINIRDVPLIIGQGLIVLTFTTYFALALYYLQIAKADRPRKQVLGVFTQRAGDNAGAGRNPSALATSRRLTPGRCASHPTPQGAAASRW